MELDKAIKTVLENVRSVNFIELTGDETDKTGWSEQRKELETLLVRLHDGIWFEDLK